MADRYLVITHRIRRCLIAGRWKSHSIATGLGIAIVWCFFQGVLYDDRCGAFASETGTNQATHEAEQFFETKIRPLLVTHCYECHAGEAFKGGLTLDNRVGVFEGGDSGPAVVPYELDESPLVQAVRYDGLEMPPKGRLSDKQIADIEQWVTSGAYWPEDGEDSQKKRPKGFVISNEDREHWAFRPVEPCEPPVEGNESRHPIDAFLNRSLREAGLTTSPTAPSRVIIRRLYLGLTGLPPSYEELEDWARRIEGDNPSSINESEFMRLVDLLLERKGYGEHWARHWLDVVRFAQSNGYERDGYKPHSWRYRDYVIRSFNDDKPYDRFVIEQLAGDELADTNSEARTATAFYRLGVWDDEPDDARQAEFDELDDVMVTIGASFMGLTIGCARCHDHKFDPISQSDYYRLLAFIRNVRRYENPKSTLDSATSIPLGDNESIRNAYAGLCERREQREQAIANAQSDEERNQISSQVIDQSLQGIEWTLGVREHEGPPPVTHVLVRGDAGSLGDVVEPGFLQVLDHLSLNTEVEAPGSTGEGSVGATFANEMEFRNESPLGDVLPSSGRRLALARWMVSPQNPLAARVIVNRVWHYHFGRGIVETTGDFGVAGSPPSHPELLDWLANDFIEHGWSLKHLHRRIVSSAAYRRSSAIDLSSGEHQETLRKDPGNRLLWRGTLRRLNGEAIRDRMLLTSGELSDSIGGPEMYPQLSAEVLAGQSRPGLDWQVSTPQDQSRRSIYGVVKRGVRDPLLQAFDYSSDSSPLLERPVTTVAPQALMLLHSQFTAERSTALAERIAKHSPAPSEQIRELYQLMFQREPNSDELDTALRTLDSLKQEYRNEASKLTFRPAVPVSLYGQYRRALSGEHFLYGPRESWSYYGGVWGGEYEGIESVDPRLGPFALWNGAVCRDGVLEGQIRIGSAVEYMTMINRGRIAENSWHGFAWTMDRKSGKLVSRVRGVGIDTEVATDSRIPPDEWVSFRWQVLGNESRLWLGNELVMQQKVPEGLPPQGSLGVAVWGGRVDFRDLTWVPALVGRDASRGDGVEATVLPGEPAIERVDVARVIVDTRENSVPTEWTRYDGDWTRESDRIWHVGANQGAKILWDAMPVETGEVQVEMNFTQGASHIAAILLGVSDPKVGADNWLGYEIGLDIRNQTVFVGDHRNNFRLLESKPTRIEAGEWKRLRADFRETQLMVFVDDAKEPAIVIDLSDRLTGKLIGLRTWGSDVRFKDFTVVQSNVAVVAEWPEKSSQGEHPIRDDLQWSQRQALAAYCRTLFNLSEFVYVE